MEMSLISLDSNVSNILDSLCVSFLHWEIRIYVEMYLRFSIFDSKSYNKYSNKETLHSLNFKI